MLYAIDSTTKSKIEVVSKEDMNTYIEQQVSSILSGGGLSLLGVTASVDELNYCSGLTSNIQTQLNSIVNGLGTAAYKEAYSGPNQVTSTNWSDTSYRVKIPDLNFLSFWNGAYTSTGGSNLAYCNQGAFGSIVTKNISDVVLSSASCNKNWNWQGLGGQPSWLWGGNDSTNMYVYNPSNFYVHRANYGPNGAKIQEQGLTGSFPAIELRGINTCYIDWHYNNSSADYTSRLIENVAGSIYLYSTGGGYGWFHAAGYSIDSSKHIKTNINPIEDNEALKILELNPVSFDYKNGDTNKRGFIAEEVMKILPTTVQVPEGYDEETFEYNPDGNNIVPSIDYASFVPYIIKLQQIHDKEIKQLKEKIKSLSN